MSDWKCSSPSHAKNGGCCNCCHHTEEGKIAKFQKVVFSNPFIKMKNQDNRFFLQSLFSSMGFQIT